jgi:bacteriorhodopsin
MLQRYICWMHTTPTILLLVKMISTTITRKQVRHPQRARL